MSFLNNPNLKQKQNGKLSKQFFKPTRKGTTMTCGLLHTKFDAALEATKEAFKEAMKIAEDVYYAKEDGKIDPTDGATFYHAVYVKPKWRHSMSSSIKIGKHIFYRWDGTWK